MNRYPNIAARLYAEPWAILPAKFEEIDAAFQARQRGELNLTADELEKLAARHTEPPTPIGGSIQVIPIVGTIHHHAGLIERASGGTSTAEVSRQLAAAMDDPEITAILFEMRTYGGALYGTPELADQIFAARGQKPIYAAVNAYAFSAGVWLALAADRVFATPSAELGSVGVVIAHRDISGAENAAGVKTSLIAVPDRKIEGNPYEPLPDDVRDELRDRAARGYRWFVESLARFRDESTSTVETAYGGGGLINARQALAVGMIDGIEPFSATVARLQSETTAGRDRTTSRFATRLALAEAESE